MLSFISVDAGLCFCISNWTFSAKLESVKYSVLVLSGNILTIKLRILRYFLRTFLALLSRALVITSSPCLHIVINPSLVWNKGSTCNFYGSVLNPFKNRVPKPSDAFRSIQNIFFGQSGTTLTGNRRVVLIRGYLATSVFGEAVEERTWRQTNS